MSGVILVLLEHHVSESAVPVFEGVLDQKSGVRQNILATDAAASGLLLLQLNADWIAVIF